jgi:DNA-binding transcriptional MerR regulator
MNTSLPAALRPGLRQTEAAAKLGVTPRTLQRWALDGFGPQPHRDGASVLYDPADVAAFASGVRA